MKKLRSDNGGKYVDAGLEQWLKEHGILHQTIPARSPQSNGVAERMNRTLQDRARSMLVGAGLLFEAVSGLRRSQQPHMSGTEDQLVDLGEHQRSCGQISCLLSKT